MTELLIIPVVLAAMALAFIVVAALTGVAIGVVLAVMLLVVDGLTGRYKKHASTRT